MDSDIALHTKQNCENTQEVNEDALALMNNTDGNRQVTSECEEPFPSLSDFHDYEPNLEFDDTEVQQAVISRENAIHIGSEPTEFLESPVSDGIIEENFEAELGGPLSLIFTATSARESVIEEQANEDFRDIAMRGIVDVVGDDTYGRKVIVVSACRLPKSNEIDHSRLLRYLLFTLDQFVEEDYTLVYFHHGLVRANRPSLSWLWHAYRVFDRKYKKNLKMLYLVHPTKFIRMVWQLFKPAISVKFGRKIMYVNYLHELRQHLHLDQICIPDAVIEHDQQLIASNSQLLKTLQPSFQSSPVFSTQQFGVSLQFLKENNFGDPIPPVVRQCVEFLSSPDMLETEGLFRRSASTALVKEQQQRLNCGEEVTFAQDAHVAAVILKKFLRELKEPLMTFELFDEIMQLQKLSREERPPFIKAMVLERLPEDNYILLKHIIHFLAKVMDRSDLNKMTASNLAVVFGPNLIWSHSQQMSLAAISPINQFTEFLLAHQEEVFLL